MSKAVGKTIYFADWEVGEMESWFSHMSEQGLHLTKVNGTTAYFEEAERMKYTYRIFLSKRGYADTIPERYNAFIEKGWEFVCDRDELYVYRSQISANAPEIRDMEELYNWISDKWKKRKIWTSILAAACLSIFLYIFFLQKYPLLVLFSIYGSVQILFFLSVVRFCYTPFRKAITMKRMLGILQEENTNSPKRSWEDLARFRKIGQNTFYIMSLSFVLITCYSEFRYPNQSLPYESLDYRLIRLSEIENDEALERIELYGRLGENERKGIDWRNYVKQNWYLLAPVVMKTNESGYISGRQWVLDNHHFENDNEYSPYLEFELYKLRFSWISNSLLRSILKWAQEGSSYSYMEYTRSNAPDSIAPTEVFDHPEFDRLFIREETVVPEMHIIATKGNHIVRIKYIGEQSLDIVLMEIDKLFDRLMS